MQYMKVSFFNYYVCTNSVCSSTQQELQQLLHNGSYSEHKRERVSGSEVRQAMAAPAPAATAANENEAKASKLQPHQQ
jgi:hypothetical protein